MLTGKSTLRVLLLTLVAASLVPAQPARDAVYLEDQPVVTAQAVARDLVARNFRITGSSSLLLNAIFVSANGARIDELRALPGVAGVVRLLPHHRALSKAVQLVNGPGTAAFNAAGALPNGGQGVKIAILEALCLQQPRFHQWQSDRGPQLCCAARRRNQPRQPRSRFASR